MEQDQWTNFVEWKIGNDLFMIACDFKKKKNKEQRFLGTGCWALYILKNKVMLVKHATFKNKEHSVTEQGLDAER